MNFLDLLLDIFLSIVVFFLIGMMIMMALFLYNATYQPTIIRKKIIVRHEGCQHILIEEDGWKSVDWEEVEI